VENLWMTRANPVDALLTQIFLAPIVAKTRAFRSTDGAFAIRFA
jgi:hypothetical protein